ncbi:MAG: GNAT family N-acetyltransferase [Hyphomicrobiaceae bacterium]
MSRAPLFTIEALASADDRSAFACGVSALDRYFREQVTQDVRRRVGNCFVAVEAATSAIAGFYTLAATSLLLTSIPDDQARRLPRYPSVPAALLARLAVATSFQGNKLGGILLADAIDRVARGDLGAFALVVDAKDANARRFYEHHGFVAIKDEPMRLLLPIATALKAGLGKPASK